MNTVRIEISFPNSHGEAADPLRDIKVSLGHINRKADCIMANLQDLQAAVERDRTVTESAVTLLQGIAQQLRDAQASNDPNAIQAVIDQIDANTNRMAEAVAANTPAAPTPTE